MYKILSNKCLICSGRLETAIKLPNLPITGIYSKNGRDKNFKKFNQELLLCSKCGHAQLKNVIDIDYLYGEDYGFRTSSSVTAKSGSIFFSNYLEKLFPGRIFPRIVDFGCSDAYLLKLLKNKGKQLLGVDLIWNGRETEFEDDKIKISGERIEDISFIDIIGAPPDLVLSVHTMEHIENPRTLLEKLFAMANQNTVFLFEFPCFDPLLENLRFDQVFHQHLQYYSVQSFLTLLYLIGGEIIDYTFDYNYWGSLLIAFKKATRINHSNQKNLYNQYTEKTLKNIRGRYALFQRQMEITKDILDKLQHETWFGYGAALMLPILGYHLNTDFSNFEAIFDDNPDKDGLGYINLPVIIKNPKKCDFSDLNICLTAMDYRRSILEKLAQKRPRRIINPLNII